MACIIRCLACRKKFKWDPTDGMPKHCPVCGEYIGHDRADDDIVLPAMRFNAKTAAVDKVYRDMEAGSVRRAEIAASMFGESPESTGLKITNMRDNQRPGDIAMVEKPNPVSELMAASPDLGSNLSQMGPYFSQNVSQGRYPNEGIKTAFSAKKLHGQGGNPTANITTKEIFDRGPRRF